MASMNAGIILAGQQPNFLNTIATANQAAAQQNQFRQQNALRDFNRENGAAVLAGDQNALNQYAGIAGPEAALGIQGQQQNMRINKEELGIRRQTARRQAEAWAQQQDDRTKAETAQKIKQGLMSAGQAFQAGDEAAFNRILQENGVDPFPMSEFPYKAAEFEGVLDAIAAASQFGKPALDTEADRELARLMSIGIDRTTAIKIKEGVYKTITDPTTKETVIIDLASGKMVGVVGDQQQDQPLSTQPTVTQPNQPNPTQPLSFGNSFEGAGDAFGLEGAMRRGVNFVGDTIGAGQVYPETSATQRDFAVMRENLTNQISSAYDGRVPAFLLQGIQDLTPQAGTIMEGPGAAQDKLRALGRSLQDELRNVSRAEQRRMNPAEKEVLAKRKQVLEASMNQIADALDGFKTNNGIRPEVADRLRAYQ